MSSLHVDLVTFSDQILLQGQTNVDGNIVRETYLKNPTKVDDKY